MIRTPIRCLTVALLLVTRPAWSAAHEFVVYTPGMGGTREQARPFLELFFRAVEGQLGWKPKSVDGQFFEDAHQAREFIEKNHPAYGLIAPSLYLELACAKPAPEPIASIVGLGHSSGSVRYYLMVKDGAFKTLEDLRGKRLSSNHLMNPKFLSRVVFAGKIDVASFFQLLATNSPVKPFKALDRGEAEAVLIDEAQFENMKSLPIGASLRVLFSSSPLPPSPVVAFGRSVQPAERDAVKKTLAALCSSPTGAPVCRELQIVRFDPLDAAAYRPAVQQYCK